LALGTLIKGARTRIHMPAPRCQKCGSEDFEEKMFAIYDVWGQFEEMRALKICNRCGTELHEEEGEKRG